LLEKDKAGRLLMIGMNLFLRVSCMSISNLLVLHSMLLINSMMTFFYYTMEVQSFHLITLSIGRHVVL